MRKTRRTILLIAIFLSLGGVAYKVTEVVRNTRQEIKRNPLTALDYLPESVLQVKDFHRAKIENGEKVWELYGDEARYLKEQKEAVIKKPRFYYYGKNGKGAASESSADEAHAYLNEKELDKLELKGSIKVVFDGYELSSEEARYLPGKDQIVLPKATKIVGEGITIEGASMEVELGEKKIRMVRNVKTKIEPQKLAIKKNKTMPNQRSGG